jgi:predicted DCC family thiol-disulfide oxidoreductase YuxK
MRLHKMQYMRCMIAAKSKSNISTTIWYDGGCPLCVREIALMRWLDRRGAIQFVNVDDDQVECPLDRSLLLARLHGSENGVMLSGAAAFAAMWRAIPVLRPIGLLARNAVVLRMLERAYVSFLKVRPRIQHMMKVKKVP